MPLEVDLLHRQVGVCGVLQVELQLIGRGREMQDGAVDVERGDVARRRRLLLDVADDLLRALRQGVVRDGERGRVRALCLVLPREQHRAGRGTGVERGGRLINDVAGGIGDLERRGDELRAGGGRDLEGIARVHDPRRPRREAVAGGRARLHDDRTAEGTGRREDHRGAEAAARAGRVLHRPDAIAVGVVHVRDRIGELRAVGIADRGAGRRQHAGNGRGDDLVGGDTTQDLRALDLISVDADRIAVHVGGDLAPVQIDRVAGVRGRGTDAIGHPLRRRRRCERRGLEIHRYARRPRRAGDSQRRRRLVADRVVRAVRRVVGGVRGAPLHGLDAVVVVHAARVGSRIVPEVIAVPIGLRRGQAGGVLVEDHVAAGRGRRAVRRIEVGARPAEDPEAFDLAEIRVHGRCRACPCREARDRAAGVADRRGPRHADLAAERRSSEAARGADRQRRIRSRGILRHPGQLVRRDDPPAGIDGPDAEPERLREVLLRQVNRIRIARPGIEGVGEAAVLVDIPFHDVRGVGVIRVRVPVDHGDAAVADADVRHRRLRRGLQEGLGQSLQSEVARGDQRVDGQAAEIRRDRIAGEDRIPRRVG